MVFALLGLIFKLGWLGAGMCWDVLGWMVEEIRM